ncbi:apolipoprotein N-acyltransferase [Corynebacterium uterequi]|uniref:Apolipoprotein N-acyltransferase n=1 Tax=Corynebacterium uterequi TaxID=1072256 RepID=A0A0G3HCF6_9CORY|nr:apolipoprotein N-acyltransferase [Corynebacterium uterequi]AKK11071.1 apolipoprotein N-acyltransferase [Corynebacterium uterequi]
MVLPVQLLLAAVSGWLAYTSYEPLGWWPAGILGIAGLYGAVSWREPSLRRGALLGFVHGVTMYLFALPWIGELVGTFPYVALAVSCALYAILTGIGGVAIARWRFGFLVFPLLYVAVEHLRSSVPFGGFAWVRLAWGQIDGPLAALASVGGPALVTAATALAGCALAAIVLARGTRVLGAIVAVTVLGASVATGAVTAATAPADVGMVEAAAIQGNVPRLGLDFNAQRRAVLANHVRATRELAASGARPDIVIWPENSSDVNPFKDPLAYEEIHGASAAIEAPILVGTITEDSHGYYNTMQVIDAEHGAGDYHRKVFLQPFGEYMPMREFFASITDLVDLASNFSPGDGNFTVVMDGVTLGVATCYEVIVDAAYRTAVLNGAQILTTPTNNATFGFSDMTYQQLAMSRMRAIEFDRAVIVAATSGVSAIVHPDGSVSQDTEIFESATLLETLPLRDSVTLSARFGSSIQWGLSMMGVVVTLLALAMNRRSTRRGE